MKCKLCNATPCPENLGYRMDSGSIVCERCLKIQVEIIEYYKKLEEAHQEFLSDDWVPSTEHFPSKENLKESIEGY